MNEDRRPSIAPSVDKPRRRPGGPRAHRLVALGLLLTAGSKLLMAGLFALLGLAFPGIEASIWIPVVLFSLYGLFELALMRQAWRGRINLVTVIAVVIGLLLFGAAGIAAGADVSVEGGILNIFSAIGATYAFTALGLLLHRRQARSAPAA